MSQLSAQSLLSLICQVTVIETDCDTGHYLVVAKVRESLTINKKRSHRFHMEIFNPKRLNEVNGKETYRVEVSNRYAALADLDTEVDINSVLEIIGGNSKISAKGNLVSYELKKHKPQFDEGCSNILDGRKQENLSG
jgi:hypothetical protein